IKFVHAPAAFIEFAVTVLPGRSLGQPGRRLGPGFHKTERKLEFVRLRWPLISRLIEPPDSLGRTNRGTDFGAPGQVSRLLNDERAVHKKQSLLRNRGGKALWTGRVRTGEVEGAKQIWQILPFDKSVNRSPPGKGFADNVHGVTALAEVQFARDRKQGIAHFLEVEPLTIHFPEKPVVRVRLRVAPFALAALLIRVREQDEPVQLLERPALVHEPGRDVIEQLGMGRRVRTQTEIT